MFAVDDAALICFEFPSTKFVETSIWQRSSNLLCGLQPFHLKFPSKPCEWFTQKNVINHRRKTKTPKKFHFRWKNNRNHLRDRMWKQETRKPHKAPPLIISRLADFLVLYFFYFLRLLSLSSFSSFIITFISFACELRRYAIAPHTFYRSYTCACVRVRRSMCGGRSKNFKFRKGLLWLKRSISAVVTIIDLPSVDDKRKHTQKFPH
jgi:hypothetical protein